jgi:protoporphyrinogen oxidase
MKNHNSAKNPLDIAIVGGGISGVYSAYRLINGRPKTPGNPEKKLAKDQPKIEIFERENRIGGRLLSMTPPGMPKRVVSWEACVLPISRYWPVT